MTTQTDESNEFKQPTPNGPEPAPPDPTRENALPPEHPPEAISTTASAAGPDGGEMPLFPPEPNATGDSVLFDVQPPFSIVVVGVIAWVIIAFISWMWIGDVITNAKAYKIICWTITGFGLFHIFILCMWKKTTRYILNHQMLTVELGFLSRKGYTIPIGHISNLSYTRHLLGAVLNYGEMQINVAHQPQPLILAGFPDVAAGMRKLAAVIMQDVKKAEPQNNKDVLWHKPSVSEQNR